MKVLTVLKNLNPTERRRMAEALSSPFFNKNTSLRETWKVLEKNEHREPADIKQRINQRIFPGQPYDDAVIRHLLSKLLKLMEEVLGIMQLQHQPAQTDLAYLQWLNTNGLTRLHEQQYNALITGTQQPASLNEYLLNMQLLQQQEDFANRHQVRHDNPVLQDVSQAMDKYFMVSKLKMACAAYSLQTMYSQQFSIGFMEEILARLQHDEALKEPLILLYYLSLQTLRSPDADEYFQQLKEELLNPTLQLDNKELLDLFILAQNYCIRKVNRGEQEYFAQLFELYKATLERGLIQSDPVQFPPAFKNIISVALRLKAFDWVEAFIKAYTPYLEPEYRDDYLNYNLARVHFEQGQYDPARELLLQVQHKDFFIGLNARMLLLKTCYELDMDDLVYAQLESFTQYLNRKGIMAYHKQNYQNNLKYVKRLLNLNRYDKARKKILLDQMNEEQVLTEKQWLLEKLQEMAR